MMKGSLPSGFVSKVSDITLKNVHIPLVFAEELEPKYALAWKRLQERRSPLGDYLEFGVSVGTSMACMHRVLEKLRISNVRLFGFDSFEGMPKSAATEDAGTWQPGEFASAIGDTKNFLNAAGVRWERTHLIKGWFDETLTAETTRSHNIEKASIIMIDCDIYSAAKTALNYSLPFIQDYAVIFFDDWRDDINFGEYKAYSEFLSENKSLQSEPFGTYKPTGKIFLVKKKDV